MIDEDIQKIGELFLSDSLTNKKLAIQLLSGAQRYQIIHFLQYLWENSSIDQNIGDKFLSLNRRAYIRLGKYQNDINNESYFLVKILLLASKCDYNVHIICRNQLLNTAKDYDELIDKLEVGIHQWKYI